MWTRLVPLLLVLAACDHRSGAAPAAQTTTSARPDPVAVAPTPTVTSTAVAVASAAVSKMVDGARLLPAFTEAAVGGATERVDRPTKEGFAEVVYKKGKDELATITITDTLAVPAVRDDYKDVKETAAGFPLKTSGYSKSAILAFDRFQVQIQSQRLKAPERKAWLEKMNLKVLQALK